MSTTYTQLKEAVKKFSGRTDAKTLDQIPQFIVAAQTHLDGNLRAPSMTMMKHYAAGELAIPNELMEIEYVVIGSAVGVLMPLEEVIRARAITDNCRFYALVGTEIWLSAPEAVTIAGYQKPQRLSDTVQTNAYTKEAENALLWQALSVLGVFARDAKAAQAWGDLAAGEINNLNMQFEKYKSGGGVTNVRPARTF